MRKNVTSKTRSEEQYFKEIFFQKVWPKMTGIEKIPDISDVCGSPEKIAGRLWESLTPALDSYIKKYELPVLKSEGQTDAQFFEALVEKMHELNQRNKTQTKWSAWPIIAQETGVSNCSLGSQIAGRVLASAGYQAEFGMPGPMSHAVVFAQAEGGKKHYLDPANGVITEVAEEQEKDGVKGYRLETDDEKIPFKLIPVCGLEKSTAATIWNLASLRKQVLAAEPCQTDPVAVKIMNRFGIDNKTDYSGWAQEHILPEWKGLLRQPEWKKEQAESSARIQNS